MWFLSVLAVFVNLMYIYAGLPESVSIQHEESGSIDINKEVVFYAFLTTVVLVNVLVYLISKLYQREEYFRAWFHGLIITINIFFVIAFSHLGLYNSTERFDYSRIGFIIYGSVGLIVLWAISWPFYLLYQKFFIKHTV